MREQKQRKKQDDSKSTNLPLAFFTCPNSDCADFNRFGADNLSAAEWMGKDKAIRRLYCKNCGAQRLAGSVQRIVLKILIDGDCGLGRNEKLQAGS
ncbi:MAG: hypothetical protein ACFFCW_49005 [Candidatus Hodarchaeota archaeon]